MPPRTRLWDVTEHLATPAACAAYLDAAFEDGDPALIGAAIGDVARARGMADVAERAGVSRESLYRSLSENGNPSFATVLKVLKALDVKLEAHPA